MLPLPHDGLVAAYWLPISWLPISWLPISGLSTASGTGCLLASSAAPLVPTAYCCLLSPTSCLLLLPTTAASYCFLLLAAHCCLLAELLVPTATGCLLLAAYWPLLPTGANCLWCQLPTAAA